MKIKNKGKVYPSPSSSSALSSDSVLPDPDFFSIFKLLPAAILALLSALSIEDREVLAYLITRSVKSVTPPSIVPETKKKSSKRVVGGGGGACGHGSSHKPPVFDCDCFDCYRSYWFRWDSSANRELIHQAIEAFEDQLTSGEKTKRNSGRSKRRDRTVRRDLEKPTSSQDRVNRESDESSPSPEPVGDNIGSSSRCNKRNLEEGEAGDTSVKKEVVKPAAEEEEVTGELPDEEVTGELPDEEDDMSDMVRALSPGNNQKGMGIARKVLPDVLGLLNHRLWSLWSPQM